jgi:hypothetical protein
MADYDLVVAGGTVVTPSDMFQADIGVVDGRNERSTRTDCW